MDRELFFIQCKNHDWFYDYSDDHRVLRAGLSSRKKLMDMVNDNPELEPIYQAWADYHFQKTLFKPILEDFI